VLAEIRGINEECGVFGIWSADENVTPLVYYGLHALQHRGQQGAGIVVKNGDGLKSHRGLGLVTEVFNRETMDSLNGTAAIGHVRYPNRGRTTIDSVQPFLYEFENSSMALCHNGNLVNNRSLRRQLEAKGSIFHTKTDSEVLAHLIKRQKSNDIVVNMKVALSQLKGAFAYILLTENEMIAALDPNGLRPLSIGRLGKAFVVSSETCAFDAIGASFQQDVHPGEVVIFNDKGMRVETFTNETSHSICSLEFIYLARPDSDIAGVNVHSARKAMGMTLAKESPVDADVVTAIPESAVSAAIGYSEAMRLPYEIGIIKNRYVARTFIQPSQELREIGVKMKLSAVRGVVSGKRVVVVDDSIVRGTTTKRCVQRLREAGATEVHVRVASPVIKFPCFYGIDIQTPEELIGFEKSVEDIRKMIGADSLAFLSEEGLASAVNLPFPDEKYGGLNMSCFNGDYPTELGDFKEIVTELREKRGI